MKRVTVLGAGSWGTTLALHLARLSREVTLWEVEPARAVRLAETRRSLPFLPDHPLPETVAVTSDLSLAAARAEAFVVAVPTHAIRSVGEALAEMAPARGAQWISAAKGIEEETLQTPRAILQATLGIPLRETVVLAGPSFALEVAAQRPTAVLAAGEVEARARAVQQLFADETFRVYTSPDPLGVEIGVALKNVIAIAAGLAEGLALGRNALGALLTRGLAEIARLGITLGARPETFLGLAGIGDLVMTATSDLSRNYRVGLALARGERLAHILDDLQMVAEGVRTCRSARRLAARHGIEMPITEQVHAVLFEAKPPRAAVLDLMQRPLKAEFWGGNQ